MVMQIKSLLEIKNYLKEGLKGTYFEEFVKGLYGSFKQNEKIEFLINAEDNKLAVQILDRILTKTSNCIDIGCNTGDFLISIMKLSPLGHHYAFEPIPRLASRLKKRFPKVNVIEAALSDSEGYFLVRC